MAIEHRAFLAMPFRPELRWVREAIRKATIQLAIPLRIVDEIVRPGEEIVAGIRQEIREATLAYVVLTDLNPNVMYELGLLHEASKPTILLSDRDTLQRLPFDIRTRMVITFEAKTEAAEELTKAVVVATGRLLALYDYKERRKFVTAAAPPTAPTLTFVNLSIAAFDWEKIKNHGAAAVGQKGCKTTNISPHDDESFRGWRLKARCAGGDTIVIYIDLNGDIASVDVQ